MKNKFPIWKTIQIGGVTKEHLLNQMSSMNITTYARELLDKIEFSKNKTKVDLVRISVRDLELEDYPTTDQIYNKAQELGLELCPAEVGPNLRVQYKDQPINEWIYVAMKQITDRRGNLRTRGAERVTREVDGLVRKRLGVRQGGEGAGGCGAGECGPIGNGQRAARGRDGQPVVG